MRTKIQQTTESLAEGNHQNRLPCAFKAQPPIYTTCEHQKETTIAADIRALGQRGLLFEAKLISPLRADSYLRRSVKKKPPHTRFMEHLPRDRRHRGRPSSYPKVTRRVGILGRNTRIEIHTAIWV